MTQWCCINRLRSDSYTTVCPTVRGDNLRALSQWIFLRRRNRTLTILYQPYISVDLAHGENFVLKLVSLARVLSKNIIRRFR